MYHDVRTKCGYNLRTRIDGSGPEKIMFVMGFASSMDYWSPLVEVIHETFPGRYTTCVYDQRGIGGSVDDKYSRFTSRTIARDILSILVDLDWLNKYEPLHLIGWSMGGFGCIEFVDMMLTVTGSSTLNLASLILCNTGSKFVLPNAVGLANGLISVLKALYLLIRGGPSECIIPNILKVHYSRKYLENEGNSDKLFELYKNRSPFNEPISRSVRPLLTHLWAVLTHYVPRCRLERIRQSGLPIHSVISADDALIHPTASIKLSQSLGCGFSYLPGGHMSHVENTEIVLRKIIELMEIGLKLKFPHFQNFKIKRTFSNPLELNQFPQSRMSVGKIEKLF
jgi:pimeloyl-ACP methyl ester carboxylesterase